MLKIKDNVDLKELEKFGFKIEQSYMYDVKDEVEDEVEDEKLPYLYARYEIKNHIMNYNVSQIILNPSLSCSEINRTLKMGCVLSKFEYESWRLFDAVLFDLIQAGLVEKVEE